MEQLYSTLDECLSAVERLLAEAGLDKSREESSALLASARETADNCLNIRPDSAEANYWAGLAMYDSFCLDEGYGGQAEKYFLRAVELDPRHQFARMFLGYYYYDTGAYQLALGWFRTVEEDFFLSIRQRWQFLTLHELILCCQIALDNGDVTISSFQSLAKEFLSADRDDAPAPVHLVSTLAKAGESTLWRRVNRGEVRAIVIELTETLGFYDVLRDRISLI
jgi:tetratricopeptide (TPR) repeat protein